MKKLLLTMIGSFAGLMLLAAPVTKETARQKAADFLTRKNGNVAAARGMRPVSLKLQDNMDCEELYVFNVGQRDGFVIVSGDDCTADVVLGYADNGEVNGDNMPENLRLWLQGYADQIKWMKEHGIQENEAVARRSQASIKTAISPLLTCNWDQGEPYNNNCPDVLDDDQVVRAASGCLATAASQVMYWHQKKYGEETGIWTTTTEAIPSYETNFFPIVTWTDETHTEYTTGNVVEGKAPTTIDWSKLVDNYPSTDEANAEVAKLMEYVGAGLKMEYGPESSAMFVYFAPMLINYFGYNKSARYVNRYDYSYEDWINLMYDQIMNVGPVFYGGQSTGGGHAFVLDGYDEEDYFHVNWGWGGHSNGYFKLSVMYSQQQGIGGSKSQDGFNFFQNATIDVNPDINAGDQNSTIRMTTYDLWTDTTSLHRASRDANFVMKEPYLVHFRVFNLTGDKQSMDVGLGLYKGNTLVKVLSSGSKDNIVNGAGGEAKFDFTFGAGMADDEYKIVPISRKKNSKTWYQNYYSEVQYIKAVINDTTLTLTPMNVVDLNVSLAVTDNPTMNQPVTVTATVTNNGPLYAGDLILVKGTHKDNEEVLCAQQVEIEQGETATVDFTFTPKNSGNVTIYLANKYGNAASEDLSFAIAPSIQTTGTLKINYKTDYTLSAGSFSSGIYGSTVSGTVKVTNTADVDHTSGLVIKLYRLYENKTSSLVDQMTTYEPIEKNSSKEIPFKLSGMVPGGKYFINVFYKLNGQFIAYTYNFKSNFGVTTYTADGAYQTVASRRTSVVVPDSVVVLDISGVDNVTSVTPNSNPNTLYIVSGSVPNGLEGKNVVLGGTAASLALSDGFDFYPSMDFFVTEAPSFTKKFTLAGDGKKGWSTIVLPFDVKQVKQGDRVLDWYHSDSEEGKDLRVKCFVNEDDSTTYFDYASEMKANTPYLIAVSSDLVNKDITFYGEADAYIDEVSNANVTSNHYKFEGSTCSKAVTNGYVLNENGSAFVKTSATIPAFQAYFKAWRMANESVLWLNIDSESETTGICRPVVVSQTSQKDVYNLNGQRVQQYNKGIYIVNGKKIVVR